MQPATVTAPPTPTPHPHPRQTHSFLQPPCFARAGGKAALPSPPSSSRSTHSSLLAWPATGGRSGWDGGGDPQRWSPVGPRSTGADPGASASHPRPRSPSGRTARWGCVSSSPPHPHIRRQGQPQAVSNPVPSAAR